MKKLSLWARDHKWQSRLIIVVSFVMLTGLGLLTGLLLYDLEVYLPIITFFLFIGICIAGFIFYPRKRSAGSLNRNRRYWRQKSCDLLLGASTFGMIVFIANRPQEALQYSFPFPVATASIPSLPKDSVLISYKPIPLFKQSLKDENGKWLKWKERKSLLKAQIKGIRESNELSGGAKVALIILSVLIAAGLIIGVASLACSLSCSGSEAAAIVVGVLGTAAVVALLIFVIKKITGKKKKEIKNPENPPPGN